MNEKKKFKKKTFILLIVLLFSIIAGRNAICFFAEKVLNPYESVTFAGSRGRYVFERHGSHCFVAASESGMFYDEKEIEIPKLLYYTAVLRVASLNIENSNAYFPDTCCVDGFICHIILIRKDGTRVEHHTYEYNFPQGDTLDRMYKFMSSVDRKSLIRDMCTEISHTKVYREIKYNIHDFIILLKNIF